MKIWLRAPISIFLGILILVTGSGISLAKMVCLKSGYTSITLTTPDDCCGESEHPESTTIEEKCCDISNVSIDILHYIVSASHHIEKSIVWTLAHETFSHPDFSRVYYRIAEHDRNYLYPPEISSPPLRISTKTFLI